MNRMGRDTGLTPSYLEFLSHCRASLRWLWSRCWSADGMLLNRVTVVGQCWSHCVSKGIQAVNTVTHCNSLRSHHEWVCFCSTLLMRANRGPLRDTWDKYSWVLIQKNFSGNHFGGQLQLTCVWPIYDQYHYIDISLLNTCHSNYTPSDITGNVILMWKGRSHCRQIALSTVTCRRMWFSAPVKSEWFYHTKQKQSSGSVVCFSQTCMKRFVLLFVFSTNCRKKKLN